MSEDCGVRKVDEAVSESPPRQADCYVWKLRVTCLVLMLWAVLCAIILCTLVQSGLVSSPTQPWAVNAVVAALGGLVGGLARALYFFSFDSYAFNHKLRTGKSSKWALSVCPDLDDKFDPLWVWYLWCLEPLVGAAVGLVFALAVGIGWVSVSEPSKLTADVSLRLLVLGGLAGFFWEGVFERMRRVVQPRGSGGDVPAQPGAAGDAR
jgi:hypothetical protein